MKEITNKSWRVNENTLGYDSNQSFIIPSVEEIYSAIFENEYCNNIELVDVKTLTNKLNFSKYPCDLEIVIKPGEDFAIVLEINVFVKCANNNLITVYNNANHIVIDNTWYPIDPNAVEEILDTLKSADITTLGKISLRQYLSLLKITKGNIRNLVNAEQLRLHQRISAEKPSGIKAELYPYQIIGWQWLRFMTQEKIGGILADEMGLGKSLQIISLINSVKHEEPFPSLIVCPATLLENWRREFERFASHISTLIHQGPNRTGFPKELRQYDIVITSYDTVVRDSSLFNQIEWKVLVCDEAQNIKNPSTKRALSLKKVPRQTAFAVTGTPIENKLTDLWSVMDFAVPEFLGNQITFEETYENSQDGPAQLETLISPLILRRKVIEVAKDLPAKIIIPQVLELSSNEILQYEQIREETEKEFNSVASLVLLTRLRLFCTHPFLISDNSDEDPSSCSNKYARLIEIIEEIVTNNSKAIVFTSFNKMNDLIASDLRKRFNIYSSSIDGRTATADRQKIVDEFSQANGSGLLVLNPIAAGTGLNITAANHVIHYNLEWNPAKEDQASARAYRRGQDRPVTIHRLFYANTIEEAIDERLTRKRNLADTALVGVKGDENDYQDLLNAIRKSPIHKS